MIGDINLALILLAHLAASASPGPATLAIAGTSMARGRPSGLLLAFGIVIGSLTWSLAAAFGLGAIMLSHGWLLEVIRYAGTAYLFFLAWKAARSAMAQKSIAPRSIGGRPSHLILRGAALHITNPKSILFFGALYALGLPSDASHAQLALVVIAVGIQSIVVFFGYALLFSTSSITRAYLAGRRWFEGAFAVGFTAAGMKILTTRLQ